MLSSERESQEVGIEKGFTKATIVLRDYEKRLLTLVRVRRLGQPTLALQYVVKNLAPVTCRRQNFYHMHYLARLGYKNIHIKEGK